MEMSSFTSTLERELFVPVSPVQAYSALRTVASGKFKLKSEDDFTLSLFFRSSLSAFTYGEKIAAQIVAADGGSTIRLAISPNVPGQLAQDGENKQIADRVFAGVVAILEAAPREEASSPEARTEPNPACASETVAGAHAAVTVTGGVEIWS